MTRGIVYLLAGVTAAELLSFQLGQEWFLPANAAAFLTVLLLINFKLRMVVPRRPNDAAVQEASQDAQPEELQHPQSSEQTEEPAVTRMEQIFPYSRHDRTNPFD
ncbi:hypothetical protein [Paenibacillus thermotolerans]|uniref:hypothetical protein n=1 Tax=Paenibacillus thermotolerans TaxID=3027807 RepID=UPI002368658D|nr:MULTISPECIES: hypothetical protein [unclassified Paenibacillus]